MEKNSGMARHIFVTIDGEKEVIRVILHTSYREYWIELEI